MDGQSTPSGCLSLTVLLIGLGIDRIVRLGHWLGFRLGQQEHSSQPSLADQCRDEVMFGSDRHPIILGIAYTQDVRVSYG